MRYSVTTAQPSYYPVTVDECKDALELTGNSAHDDKLLIMLRAATEEAESYTGAFFAQREAVIRYDSVVTYYRLPVYPIRSMTAESKSSGSFSAFTDFDADLADVPPLVKFNSLPSVDDGLSNVRFTAQVGYESSNSPADADLIPYAVKEAIIFHVYQSFLTRGELSDVARHTFRNMLHPYRVLGL